MREVGLAEPSGLMHLFKNDLTGGASLGAPEGHVALKRAQLNRLIAARVQQAELVEERFDLERRVTLQLGLDPGPILLEGIGAGATAWLLELARQLGQAFIFAGGAHTHAGSSRGLFLGFAFFAFVYHASDLVVGFHGALLLGAMVPGRSTSGEEGMGSFDDRHRQFLLSLNTARWSLRLLAEKVVEAGLCEQVSHTFVADVLKKTN